MKAFSFFQTIDDYKTNKNEISFDNDLVKIKIIKKYFYKDNETKIYLAEEDVLGIDDKITIKLKDENYDWDGSSLYIDLILEINNAKYLFENSHYACEDAVLGIGVEWKSNQSRIKKCKKIGSINISNYIIKISETLEILDLTSDVNFNLKIYVEEPGIIGKDFPVANDHGLIIGTFKFLSIKIDGNSSIFPVREISDKTAPLWMVESSCGDIYEDLFDDENIKIIINKGHKSYEYIQNKHKNYNPAFLSEVMSSAVSTLISQIMRDEDNKIDFRKSHEQGSVVQALKYFRDVLKFDLDNNYFSLYTSVKKYFDKEF